MLVMMAMLLIFGKHSYGRPATIDLRDFKKLSLMVGRWSLFADEPKQFPFSSRRAWAATACSFSSADSPLSTTTSMSSLCHL